MAGTAPAVALPASGGGLPYRRNGSLCRRNAGG